MQAMPMVMVSSSPPVLLLPLASLPLVPELPPWLPLEPEPLLPQAAKVVSIASDKISATNFFISFPPRF